MPRKVAIRAGRRDLGAARGRSAAVPYPTRSASVEVESSSPSHLNRVLWRVSGLCIPYLSKRDGREQMRTDEAARRCMERRRRLADRLAVTAGNFSRTVSITLNRRGISFSVSVTSSPSLESRDPPQHAQVTGDRSPRARAQYPPATAFGPAVFA